MPIWLGTAVIIDAGMFGVRPEHGRVTRVTGNGNQTRKKDDYIFRCDFFELKELIDVKPDTGSCYIRSVCEPFDIEMELDLKKAENWLTHFGLYPYTQIHASGKMNYDEIREVIETVQPKVLIPVHTQHPEVFRNFHDNVILPEKGVAINI